jgi:hypothetical protein
VITLGVGDGVGFEAGAALLIATPSFQISFFFFLMQVYFFPLYSEIFPTFEQEDPGLIGAAEIALLEIKTRAIPITIALTLRFIMYKNRTTASIRKPFTAPKGDISLRYSRLVRGECLKETPQKGPNILGPFL